MHNSETDEFSFILQQLNLLHFALLRFSAVVIITRSAMLCKDISFRKFTFLISGRFLNFLGIKQLQNILRDKINARKSCNLKVAQLKINFSETQL